MRIVAGNKIVNGADVTSLRVQKSLTIYEPKSG